MRHMRSRRARVALFGFLLFAAHGFAQPRLHHFGPSHHDYIPPSGSNPPVLNYLGGALVAHASYWMIYWGPYWNSGLGLWQRKHLNSFVQTVAPAPAFTALFAEYQKPLNPILAAGFGGEVSIPTAPGASTNDTAIQSQISSWISAGTLPIPDANTVYVMLFPPGADVISGSSSCDANNGFLGY